MIWGYTIFGNIHIGTYKEQLETEWFQRKEMFVHHAARRFSVYALFTLVIPFTNSWTLTGTPDNQQHAKSGSHNLPSGNPP